MTKVFDPGIAASTYANTSKMGGGTSAAGERQEASFMDFMQEAVERSVDTMHEGEKMAAKAVTGEADLTAVVQAATDAEITLQTVVSIRDRMVSAYQEIMRMPV